MQAAVVHDGGVGQDPPRRQKRLLVFPEVRSPCSTDFWFPKSLEYWLRLSVVYCNTKDNPLQTNGFPIKLYISGFGV
jgi:hypothetical protein